MADNASLDIDVLHAAADRACGLLRALGNPDRLLLLCQLAGSERCVTELAQMTGITQPTLSQQLGVLRTKKLVLTRRDGKQIYYRIASDDALALLNVLYQRFCSADAPAPAPRAQRSCR